MRPGSTEKLTSVHTGLYAYLQPIAATALGLYRHQIELGYDNLVAAILIFVGIVLVIITYVKFRFPAPGAGKTSGGDRSEPVSIPGVSVPPPAGGERGRSDAPQGRSERPSRRRIDKGGGGISGETTGRLCRFG